MGCNHAMPCVGVVETNPTQRFVRFHIISLNVAGGIVFNSFNAFREFAGESLSDGCIALAFFECEVCESVAQFKARTPIAVVGSRAIISPNTLPLLRIEVRCGYFGINAIPTMPSFWIVAMV
ncbi:hypothetical protein [Xanthomonas hortorum]|uniref:Uncharacterized protein n=1 Tax=Xanthomonas hortorum TaxID=56454 RepID=A0AA47EYR4_9XANT|nr:hypothetical protein [Xanthomonas hortorum]WAH66838.1 hypothetical protein OEG85_06720 [Xanthomonas hortorum]